MVVARQLGANDLPEIYSAFKARFIGEAVLVHSFKCQHGMLKI